MLNNNLVTGVILLDVGRAFDRVWHDKLIYKMIKLVYLKPLMRTIDSTSKNRKAEAGVP